MGDSYLEHTNIIAAYAGYYKDEAVLKRSSSGGIATAISEALLRIGGIVYGAAYAEDYYSAHYLRVTEECGLTRLKGSKYVYVEKKCRYEDNWISVYEAVCKDVVLGKKVLFVGLSCDVAALKKICREKNITDDDLYTIELLCDGVTNEIVHKNYVDRIEEIHKSKVIDFTVRDKRDGWTPLYVFAKMKNGNEHRIPFYNSAYGYSFLFYKKTACYSCIFKKKNHYADMTIGDYWGCEPGMKEYNKNGVSIAYVQTEKGGKLLDEIDSNDFMLMKTDAEYALRHSPRYFDSHSKNPMWCELDGVIKKAGIFEAVRMCSETYSSEYVKDIREKPIVLWGAGNCFHKLTPYVLERTEVLCVIDTALEKWDTLTEYGIICKSPEAIKGLDVFVLIMVENAAKVCQIVNKLIDMGITCFDHIENWIRQNF